jgi:hypothetical protein
VEEFEYYLSELPDEKVIIKVFLQESPTRYQKWMQTMHVRCSHNGKEIVNGKGVNIKRGKTAAKFHSRMGKASRNTDNIALEVFKSSGKLKDELIFLPTHKGTACWGQELERGTLFIIEYIQVDKPWRKKGLGKCMVSCLMDKASSWGPDFTLIIPRWLNDEMKRELHGRARQEQNKIRVREQNNIECF